MLEYKVTDEEPEDFSYGKKIKFSQYIILNNHVIDQAIIAQSTSPYGGDKTAFFLYNDNGIEEGKTWNLELEALSERDLLIKLADLSDNLEVQIK